MVGLGFGAEFIPLYQKHPDAECYAICERDKGKLNKVGDLFKVERRFTRFEDLLKTKEIDAIHVVTPSLPTSAVPIQPGVDDSASIAASSTRGRQLGRLLWKRTGTNIG